MQKEKELALTGNHETGYKVTKPKPKDWAYVKKNEGRSGKTKRQKIKLKEVVFDTVQLAGFLVSTKAGLPECKWTITCNKPNRRLTAEDFLRIQYEGEIRTDIDPAEDIIEVSYNKQHRIIHIEELEFLPQRIDNDHYK